MKMCIFSFLYNLNCYYFSLTICCSLPASPRRLANLRDVQHMARLQEVSQLPCFAFWNVQTEKYLFNSHVSKNILPGCKRWAHPIQLPCIILLVAFCNIELFREVFKYQITSSLWIIATEYWTLSKSNSKC